ncbi:MAG: metallophosphoesterase [Gracilibacteraceae bacterium]|nr:metallophosphoesterase [Gracilibacteraceae bacterium]
MFDKMFYLTAIAVLVIIADMIFEVNFPIIREVNIDTEKIEKGKEIVFLQISDFHGSSSVELVNKMVSKADKIKPDAVFITGDLVDETTKDFDNIHILIKKLYSICSDIFFVSGNHEWNNDKKTELLRKLKELGVKISNNKGFNFAIRGTDINICGVDDSYRGQDNIEKAMKSADNKNYIILISHSPKIRDRLRGHSPDLIISGHTHGGQVRLPLIGAIISPVEGLFPKYDKGIYKLNNGSILYIDSGVGTSKLPIRFLNRSQMSLIKIVGTGRD